MFERAVRYTLMVCLIFTAAIVTTPTTVAQEFGRVGEYETTGAAYNTFFLPGEATVQVQVLGSIGSTGIWEIGVSVDLGQLVALTGGPSVPLSQSTQGATRSYSEGTVKLYREVGGRRDLIYEAPMDRMLQEPDLYPPLQDGDILLMETVTHQTNRLTWRDAVLLLNTVISTAVLVDNLRSR